MPLFFTFTLWVKEKLSVTLLKKFFEMTKIISFISRKGGTGKTTNAINLATYLAKKKNNIILVETDPNYTINSLRKLELF